MPITYNVYKGDPAGGPVDYSALVANVAGLTYTGSALADDTRTRFGVRATDGTLEERNTDAQVLIAIGPAGEDLAGIPAAPVGLRAVATAGGTAAVEWAWPHKGAGGPVPTGFHVYLTAGGVPSYATPAATVPFAARSLGYHRTLSGLANGTSYVVAVRAFNLAGEEQNTAVATVVGDTVPPSSVLSLAATPVSG